MLVFARIYQFCLNHSGTTKVWITIAFLRVFLDFLWGGAFFFPIKILLDIIRYQNIIRYYSICSNHYIFATAVRHRLEILCYVPSVEAPT